MAAPAFLAAAAKAAAAAGKRAATRAAVRKAANTAAKAAGAGGDDDNNSMAKWSLAIGVLGVFAVFGYSLINGLIVGASSMMIPGSNSLSADTCILFPDEEELPPEELNPDHDHPVTPGEPPIGESTEVNIDGLPDASEGEAVFPFPDGYWYARTSGYGPRNIGGGASRFHRGVDYGAPRGTPLLNVLDGRVFAVSKAPPGDPNWARGLNVRVLHNYKGRAILTLQQHLDTATVKVGDEIKAGDQIGTVGNSGLSVSRGGGGYHLHFEYWTNPASASSTIDPEPWLKSLGATKRGKGIDPDQDTESVYSGDDLRDADSAEVCRHNANPAGPGEWGGHKNGAIPSGELASPDFADDALLYPRAARSLERLNKEFKAEFNKDLTIVSSYMSLLDQKECKETEEKTESGLPSLEPKKCPQVGKHPQGWGKTIVLGAPISAFDSDEYKWLAENAAKHKWRQPTPRREGGVLEDPRYWEFFAS